MTLQRGLTLGKYAPFHQGHQLVIETALAEMDEVVVIIYDSPEVTAIPLKTRANWIQAIYPNVQLVEAWGGPSEVGYTAEIMRAHEDYIIKELGITGITHFYSSEPYGEHMSVALNAVDRRVDPGRVQVPISATALRNDRTLWKKYVHPIVFQDLVALSTNK